MNRIRDDRRSTILIGVQISPQTKEEHSASMQELERLCKTLGLQIVAQFSQARPSPAAATVIGAGKLKEIAQYTGGTGEISSGKAKPSAYHNSTNTHLAQSHESTLTKVVVIDYELSPSQMQNLERALNAKVMDRRGVIIEIFSRHAKTREAKIQVEIAQLQYLLPSLRFKHAGGDRQRGGSGGGLKARGSGETPFEIEKRVTQKRLNELKRQLAEISKDRKVQANLRQEVNKLAIVGYTNAGKSSLMRALTGWEAPVEDQLFATLDVTAKIIKTAFPERILVFDTVGFIKKLPHDLVASFRSTLEVAKTANFCLHVVDAANEAFRSQISVTQTVLAEIGAKVEQNILILNKIDCLSSKVRDELRMEFPDAVQISTKNPDNIDQVRKLILSHFEKQKGKSSA